LKITVKTQQTFLARPSIDLQMVGSTTTNQESDKSDGSSTSPAIPTQSEPMVCEGSLLIQL